MSLVCPSKGRDRLHSFRSKGSLRRMGPEFRSAIIVELVSVFFVRLRKYTEDGNCASLESLVQLVVCPTSSASGERDSEHLGARGFRVGPGETESGKCPPGHWVMR